MSKRPLTASTPAEPGDRVRLTAEFERTQLLGILFGEFDRNLVAIENRLGVYISARGNRVQIEGEAEAAARAGRSSSCASGSSPPALRPCRGG